jgi:hypothetical protein
MRGVRGLIVVVFVLFVSLLAVSAYTDQGTYNECYNCSDCNAALHNGTYNIAKLANNIQYNNTCISIENNSRTFDCQNYNITGNKTEERLGINITANTTTIRNCYIQSYDMGVFVDGITDVILQNITSRNNSGHGIYIVDSLSGQITNITLNNNTNHGLLLLGANNVTIVDLISYNNELYGLWLINSSGNTINDTITRNNGFFN